MSDFGDAPFYCLAVFISGVENRIYGMKHDLEVHLDRYARGPDNGSDWSDTDVFDIIGICDSCDRAPYRIVVKAGDITSIQLHLYT